MAAVRCKTAGFQWKQLFAVTKCSVTYPNSRLLRLLADWRACKLGRCHPYLLTGCIYTRILVYMFKSEHLYTHTHAHTYIYIFKRVHRHVDTSRSISRHRVTDGSCTHLPSFRPSFPRKWSQVDPPPPPETPLMTKLANFDQLGSYLPPPFPISSSSLSLSPLHLLLSLSFSRLSLSSSHPWPTCSLSNARRIYLDR